jgi:hypothetical protein
LFTFHVRQPAEFERVPESHGVLAADTLRRAGGNARHTELTGHGHDVWTVAYRDVEVLRWLLVQRRT